MKKFRWIMAIVTLTLMGCTNPMDVRIPIGADGKMTDTEDFKKIVEKLPQADKEVLVGYLLRSAMVAAMTNTPMTAVTIGEAIAAQKRFVAEQKAKAEVEVAEQAKQAAEAKAMRDAAEAKIKRIKEMMSAYLLSKEYVKADYMTGQVQDSIRFSIAFKNNTEKKIAGVKGKFEFFNSLGDRISGLSITIESNIEPIGGAVTWNGSMNYNPFMPDNVQLANAPLDKLQTDWVPSMIMFADGTVERLEAE
jgi:hypothetical protein